MRKIPRKKQPKKLKPRSNLDPSKLALAALDRIREILTRSGHEDRLGEPLALKELVAQASLLGEGRQLPPSYAAAMRVASKVGDPDLILAAGDMASKSAELVSLLGLEGERYLPFCVSRERLYCFDRAAKTRDDELPVVVLENNTMKTAFHSFGEWIDAVADAREEMVERAASLPAHLKRLLADLGFRFDYPVVGRLETGDTLAIEELLGRDLARSVRGDVDRLFDSSGKASLTLNVDEFTLAVSLRTGIYVFEAEDVFRWLRYFRDENFFGPETGREPSHPDQVRDLRIAPREPPLILRGTLEQPDLGARRHTFRAASGSSADDFYLLARTSSTSDRAPSLILHVVDGEVATAHALDEPLIDLYVTPGGTMWGLSSTHAVLFSGGKARTFTLERPTPGRAWWYGIGGGEERVLVWGAGALLEFDGTRFRPFEPDAGLDASERVIALSAWASRIHMLVCGDEMGAMAQFDGSRWLPIHESQVIEGALLDMDLWRGVGVVLVRGGTVWRLDQGAPRKAKWDPRDEAFVNEAGTPRPMYGVKGHDGGLLIASDGGVISIGTGAKEPIFHAARGTREPARLVRVGGQSVVGVRDTRRDPDEAQPRGIVATCGPHAWVWRGSSFSVLDLREW
ncbi:MAG: hypothetical protein JNL38_40650 [Myxococcales bacterium]|jgi:hypothetical protein|nr:hypothetical protein [Myxococcales bacterium]